MNIFVFRDAERCLFVPETLLPLITDMKPDWTNAGVVPLSQLCVHPGESLIDQILERGYGVLPASETQWLASPSEVHDQNRIANQDRQAG